MKAKGTPKQRRVHVSKKRGSMTFSLGKSFGSKARAKGYAGKMRKKKHSARVVKSRGVFAVYTRRK